MIKVRINGRELGRQDGDRKVSGLIAALSDEYPPREVITRVVVDDRELDPRDYDRFDLSGDVTADLETERIEDLVGGILGDLRATLERLSGALRASAALIIEGEVENGQRKLIACSRALAWSAKVMARTLVFEEGEALTKGRELLLDLDRDLQRLTGAVSSGREGKIFEELTGEIHGTIGELINFFGQESRRERLKSL